MQTTSSFKLMRNGRLIRQNVGKHLSKAVLRRPLNTSSEPFIQITTLPNKIRVATESTPGHFSSVGLYIDAGARYETPQSSGVSHFLDRMAFKVNVHEISIRGSINHRPVDHCYPNRHRNVDRNTFPWGSNNVFLL